MTISSAAKKPSRKEVLSVEKQLAKTLYYLKDQGSLAMTANAFGVALSTVSVVVRKVYDVIATVLGSQYIKFPSTPHEMTAVMRRSNRDFNIPYPGKPRAFDYSLCPGSGEFDL